MTSSTLFCEPNAIADYEAHALLREARFVSIDVFYVGLAFRGWVSQA